jgi:sRNA-binding regulator protein Hfq
MSTSAKFLSECQSKKILMKVFLQNGTMLEGFVVDFDELDIVIDKCLVAREKIISITPKNK